jgi:hypothetical protein
MARRSTPRTEAPPGPAREEEKAAVRPGDGGRKKGKQGRRGGGLPEVKTSQRGARTLGLRSLL